MTGEKETEKEENIPQHSPLDDTRGKSGQEDRGGVFAFLFETIKFAVIALLIVVPFRVFIAQPYIVSGASMEETFSSGTYLIVDQLTYRFNDPDRGDVIIFRLPQDPSKFLIKRVIGLPGETVEIQNGRVTITNVGGERLVLTEPYINPDDFRDTTMKKLLDGTEYFVMGDNRDASLDSRIWGPLPEKNIVGEAFLSLFPITDIALHPGRYNPEEATR
ncbi:MAG: signal peptidase I [Parcubacteria group bacterium]|nr:signal peptidase I [Parcubacteria group bacterium]